MAAKNTGGKKRTRKPKTKPGAPGAIPAGDGDNSAGARLSADEEQALFLQHRSTWNAWKAKRKAVDAIERDVKAALKGDGFLVAHFVIADQLTTLKGEKRVTGEVRDRLKVARWIGHPMGRQADLFEQPDRTPSVEVAFDAGKIASMENQGRKPPHAPETEQYRAWMDGYDEHQATLAGQVGRGAGASAAPDLEMLPAEPDSAELADKAEEEQTSGDRVSRSEFSRRLQDMGRL